MNNVIANYKAFPTSCIFLKIISFLNDSVSEKVQVSVRYTFNETIK